MTLDVYFVLFFLSWAISRVGLVYLISYASRSQYAENHRIYKILIPVEQHNQEKLWSVSFFVDALGFAVLAYWGVLKFTEWDHLPTLFQTVNSFGALALAHAVIAEPLYYGYHRLLHKHPSFRQHHIKHHSATIPSPPSSYTFTLAERMSYLLLFALPVLIVGYFGQLTPLGFFAYFLVFDFLNSIGHCNFEFFPKWYLNSPLKWVVYSPSFHSLHHSRWEANYALFMPIYDWLFDTVAEESDVLFQHAQSGHGPKDLVRLKPRSIP
jgi:aldehyde decarbonylase